MKPLEIIKAQLRLGKFELTRHAFKRTVERNISKLEIQTMAESMEIIEDYPDDKYAPSSLLLGFTEDQRALHIQVSRMDSESVKVITLYEPDGKQWIDFRRRQ